MSIEQDLHAIAVALTKIADSMTVVGVPAAPATTPVAETVKPVKATPAPAPVEAAPAPAPAPAAPAPVPPVEFPAVFADGKELMAYAMKKVGEGKPGVTEAIGKLLTDVFGVKRLTDLTPAQYNLFHAKVEAL